MDWLHKFVEQAFTNELKTASYPKNMSDFGMKVSFGQGVVAQVPWITFLANGMSTSNGFYPCYLLYKDVQKLVLAFGISEDNTPDSTWSNESIGNASRVKDVITNPHRYGNSYVHTVYDLIQNGEGFDIALSGRSQSDDELDSSLKEILDLYRNDLPEISAHSQSSDDIHLLLKWTTAEFPNTIELHDEWANRNSAHEVIWSSTSQKIADSKVQVFNEQIQAGKPTYVYLYGGTPTKKLTRWALSHVYKPDDEFDRTLMPNYYTEQFKNGKNFLLLRGSPEVIDESIDNHLIRINEPETPISSAFQGQVALMYVRPKGMTISSNIENSFATAINWSIDQVADAITSLTDDSPQIILQGPPGTGKTYVAEKLGWHLLEKLGTPQQSDLKIIQFHPTYSYEDFIQGLRPVTNESGNLEFKPTPGSLMKLVDEMRQDGRPRVLVIDEMNRANLPKVMGELLYSLEYRDRPISLVNRENFSLPKNLFIIGTMNTSDRSIHNIDIAIRRRFDFFDLNPSSSVITNYYSKFGKNLLGDALVEGFQALNAKLEEELGSHYLIGHSYFLSSNFGVVELNRVWKHQIKPLINEYFFDRTDLAQEFELEKFWSIV